MASSEAERNVASTSFSDILSLQYAAFPFYHNGSRSLPQYSFPSPAPPTAATVPVSPIPVLEEESSTSSTLTTLLPPPIPKEHHEAFTDDEEPDVGGVPTSSSASPGSEGEGRPPPSSPALPLPSSLPSQPTIYMDAKFDSFESFRVCLDEWMKLFFHPFRVASSERLKESDGSLNELFQYRYIVYHCAHYGSPRKRGIGKRPNQNYLPCGCKANLRLNYSFNERCLKITTLKIDHRNHELSHEAFTKVCDKIRRGNAIETNGSRSNSPCEGGKRKRKAVEEVEGEKAKRIKKSLPSSPIPTISPFSFNGQHLQDLMLQQQRILAAQQNTLSALMANHSPPQKENQEPSWPLPPPNLPAPVACRPLPNPSLLNIMMQQGSSFMSGLAPFPVPWPLPSLPTPALSTSSRPTSSIPSPIVPTSSLPTSSLASPVVSSPTIPSPSLRPVKPEPVDEAIDVVSTDVSPLTGSDAPSGACLPPSSSSLILSTIALLKTQLEQETDEVQRKERCLQIECLISGWGGKKSIEG